MFLYENIYLFVLLFKNNKKLVHEEQLHDEAVARCQPDGEDEVGDGHEPEFG